LTFDRLYEHVEYRSDLHGTTYGKWAGEHVTAWVHPRESPQCRFTVCTSSDLV
jgi:hypothetical protein